MTRFERTETRRTYEGVQANVRIDTISYDDGGNSEREVVEHPGAVGIVAHDGDHVWLVRQPREAVDEPDLLELPAGKLDHEGETPLQTGQRELEEEIGMRAETWEELKWIYTSPGFADERVWIYEATGLSEAGEGAAESEEEERIEVVTWPLDDLDALIADVTDAKTVIGLMLLRQKLR